MTYSVNIENSKRGKKDDSSLGTVERFEKFVSSIYEGLQAIRKAEATDEGTGLQLSELQPERLKDLAEKAAFAAGSMYRYAELMRELAD